jgi:multidrug resistance efflux pump
MTDRDIAQLNLDRTKVRASAKGVVTNFDLRPGASGSQNRKRQTFEAIMNEHNWRVRDYMRSHNPAEGFTNEYQTS